MTIEKYDLEDLLLAELRRQPCFLHIDNNDVSLILVNGTLDLGRLAEHLWERLPALRGNPP